MGNSSSSTSRLSTPPKADGPRRSCSAGRRGLLLDGCAVWASGRVLEVRSDWAHDLVLTSPSKPFHVTRDVICEFKAVLEEEIILVATQVLDVLLLRRDQTREGPVELLIAEGAMRHHRSCRLLHDLDACQVIDTIGHRHLGRAPFPHKGSRLRASADVSAAEQLQQLVKALSA